MPPPTDQNRRPPATNRSRRRRPGRTDSAAGDKARREKTLVVGQVIKNLRDKQNLTQQQLAEASGVSFQQIQKYEKGDNQVSVPRLILIADAVGWPAARVMAEIEAVLRSQYPPEEPCVDVPQVADIELARRIATLDTKHRSLVEGMIGALAPQPAA